MSGAGSALRAAKSRQHPAWWAFIVHRISGLALAVFLPLHFLMLGTAINGAANMQGWLDWTANPLVKVAEVVLVGCLAAHLVGGLRVMALEWLSWTHGQKNWLVAIIGIGFFVALMFALNLFGQPGA